MIEAAFRLVARSTFSFVQHSRSQPNEVSYTVSFPRALSARQDHLSFYSRRDRIRPDNYCEPAHRSSSMYSSPSVIFLYDPPAPPHPPHSHPAPPAAFSPSLVYSVRSILIRADIRFCSSCTCRPAPSALMEGNVCCSNLSK